MGRADGRSSWSCSGFGSDPRGEIGRQAEGRPSARTPLAALSRGRRLRALDLREGVFPQAREAESEPGGEGEGSHLQVISLAIGPRVGSQARSGRLGAEASGLLGASLLEVERLTSWLRDLVTGFGRVAPVLGRRPQVANGVLGVGSAVRKRAALSTPGKRRLLGVPSLPVTTRSKCGPNRGERPR